MTRKIKTGFILGAPVIAQRAGERDGAGGVEIRRPADPGIAYPEDVREAAALGVGHQYHLAAAPHRGKIPRQSPARILRIAIVAHQSFIEGVIAIS